MKERKNQRNIIIDDYLWKKVGVLAAEMEVTKKDLVSMALKKFIEINENK